MGLHPKLAAQRVCRKPRVQDSASTKLPQERTKKLGSWTWEGSWNDCPAPSQAKSPFCSISISCRLSAVGKLLWTEAHTSMVNGLRGLKSSFFSRAQSCVSRFHINTEMHLSSDDTKG